MKIRHKLTLGFVSIALLIGAVGFISLRIGQTMLQKAIGENSATLASQLLDKIDRTIYKRIFAIFQTLSPRDELESAGMGLTTAKKIVELYGGKIWVESRPSHGSSFFFTCPVRKETQHAELQTNTAC